MQTSFNTNLFYSIIGTGKPVLLVHGFTEDSRVWDKIIPYLKNVQLIVPDLPGSGKSAMIPQGSMENYAQCLKEILDEEKIDKATIIGHSMGGYISMAFLEMFPERIERLGLFHSSAYADSDEKKSSRTKSIESLNNISVESYLKTLVPGLFFDAEKSAVDIQMLIEHGKDFTVPALQQYLAAMRDRPNRSELLKTLKEKVLFILGKNDKAVPFDLGMAQTHLAPATELLILKNSAHMGMLEETEKAGLFLNNYLDQY